MQNSYYRKYLKYKKKYLNLKNNSIGGSQTLLRNTLDDVNILVDVTKDGKSIKKVEIQLDKIPELTEIPLKENYETLTSGAAEEIDYRTQYKDEYDPQFFLKIFQDTNIIVKDQSDKQRLFPHTAVHTSWEETINLIKQSCNDFIEKVDKNKETIMLIPLFGDTGGVGLSKSNCWFSLLYLNILINELDFPIKDVVMVGLNESPYFKNLIKEPVSFNILICDDGSYSGNQILMNVLPRIFQFDIL